MDFLEKLNFLMKSKELNKNSLSKLSGIPYTTIDGWYKKGYESMQLSSLKKLSSFFNTTLDFWVKDSIVDSNNEQLTNFHFEYNEVKHIEKYRILDSYGKEVVDNILDIEHRRCLDSNDTIHKENRSSLSFVKVIPLADASLSAGTGIEPLTDTAEGIEVDLREYPKADIAFKVKGDSMEPNYYDGDIVYVKSQPVLDNGQIGAFLYNDEQYIKRYVIKDGKCILRSLNKKYKDIEVKENDSFTIYGRVLN